MPATAVLKTLPIPPFNSFLIPSEEATFLSVTHRYDRRTSVERVNSRLDNVLEFERHHIRGLKKMRVRVGLALCVMLIGVVLRPKVPSPAPVADRLR